MNETNDPQTITRVPRQVTCPTCHKQVAWVETEPYRPFCSKQCQLIDFGDWAAERHGIPADDDDETNEEDRPRSDDQDFSES